MGWIRRIYERIFNKNKPKLLEEAKFINSTKPFEQSIKESTYERKLKDDEITDAYKTGLMMGNDIVENIKKGRLEGTKRMLVEAQIFMIASNITLFKKDDRSGKFHKIMNLDEEYDEFTEEITQAYIKKAEKEYKQVEIPLDDKKIKKINIVPIESFNGSEYLVTVLNNNLANEKDFNTIMHKGIKHALDIVEQIHNIEKSAQIDELTQLENKASYTEKIEELFNNGDTKNLSFTLADLFKLKTVNDRMGHECGDAYIKSAAESLAENFPKEEDNFVYRIGGDEFVILSQGKSEEYIKEKMENSNKAMNSILGNLNVTQRGLNFIINHGTSKVSEQIDTPNKLYKEADQKLYVDKAIAHQKVKRQEEKEYDRS